MRGVAQEHGRLAAGAPRGQRVDVLGAELETPVAALGEGDDVGGHGRRPELRDHGVARRGRRAVVPRGRPDRAARGRHDDALVEGPAADAAVGAGEAVDAVGAEPLVELVARGARRRGRDAPADADAPAQQREGLGGWPVGAARRAAHAVAARHKVEAPRGPVRERDLGSAVW